MRHKSETQMKYRIYSLSKTMTLDDLSIMFDLPMQTIVDKIAEGSKLLKEQGSVCEHCFKDAMLTKYRGKELCEECLCSDATVLNLEDYIRRKHDPMISM